MKNIINLVVLTLLSALPMSAFGGSSATILSSSSNPSLSGSQLTLTATVIGSSPTGTAIFKDGATTLGTGTLVNGKTTYSSSILGNGLHTITAVYDGDAGNTASTSFALSQSVSPSSGITAIAAGWSHTAALKTDGSVVAWGDNTYGQTSVPNGAKSGVIAVVAGWNHTVALKGDGSVVAWGDNTFGQTTVPSAASSGIIAIAAGESHTMALKSDGSLVIWGDNSFGQTTVPPAAASGIIAIAAGGIHTLALKNDGSLLAWGDNSSGQTTVPPAAASGITAITAGNYHTVALKSDGSVLVWGDSYYGQTAVPSAATSGVIAIAAGGGHTLALKTNGSVVAWGDNGQGQATVPASASSGVLTMAAGRYHSVVLKSDGTVVAWGNNGFGQTTVPSVTLTVTPTGTVPTGQAVAVAGDVGGINCSWNGTTSSGNCVSTAVFTASKVTLSAILPPYTAISSWGTGCDATTATTCTIKSLTANTTISPVTVASIVVPGAPTGVVATGGITQATVNFTPPTSDGRSAITSYTVTSSGGQTATGTTSPITVKGLSNTEYTFTVTATNAAGNGPASVPSNSVTPTKMSTSIILGTSSKTSLPGASVTFTATVTGISPTGMVTFKGGAVNLGTSLVAGGKTTYSTSILDVGQHVITAEYSGDGANSPSTSLVVLLSVNTSPGVLAVASGEGHTLALKNGGSVVAWGTNNYGQTTVPLAASSGILAIAAGGNHSVAINNDSSVIAWGRNDYGQTSVPVSAASGVVAIAANYHTVALKADGSVIAWGYNSNGQATVPASVASGVVAIAAGVRHTVAQKSDGTLVAWGDSSSGQTTVPAAATGVVAVAAGRNHTVALKDDGSVIAWGGNGSGQATPPPATSTGVIAIATGLDHSVALKADGSVIVWGGQTTVPTSAASGVIAIAAGGYQTVALKSDGSVVVWGAVTEVQGLPNLTMTVNPVGAVAKGQTVAVTGNAGGINCIWNGTTSSGACSSGPIIKSTKVVLTASLPPNTIIDSWGTGCDATTATTCTINSLAANMAISPVTAANATVPGAPTGVTATGGTAQATVSFTAPVSNGGSSIRSYIVTSSGGQTAIGTASPIVVSGLTYGMTYTFTVTTINGVGAGPVSAPSNSVTPIFVTSTILSSSSNPAFSGTAVTFTAIVIGSGPTGTVTFKDGATTLGVGVLASGRAAFTTDALGAGQHSVTAVYGGDAANTTSASFVLQQSVNTYSGVIAISAGKYHSLSLTSDGSVVASGANYWGQMTVPSAATSGVIAIEAGNGNSVALKNDGSVVTWGFSDYGLNTVPAAANSGVVAISAGWSHIVVLKNDGSVVGWGNNDSGQSTVPASAASGVIAIAAGEVHSVALKNDGSVIAWGDNTYGQITIPAVATSGVIAITAGAWHTVALKSDGSVVAWGYNTYGQTTIPAAATSGVIAITAGGFHTVALKSDGSVIAWGRNTNEWGDSQSGQATVPPAAGSGVVAIAAGIGHTVVLKSDGSVVAWGWSDRGQTILYRSVTISPSGPVASGQSIVITGNEGGINCSWNGTTTADTCVSNTILTGSRVVLTATLPSNTIIESWGVGCDATTATTCTINNLAANTTISPVFVANATIPGAPTGINSTLTGLQASVSFTPPAANGGSAIRSYTVTSSGGQTVTGTASPLLVPGLSYGTSYTFTVTATNGVGIGPASVQSNSVTPKVTTSTILTTSSNPALVGAAVTFTATMTTVSAGNPTGTVTFKDGVTTLGTGDLVNGRATCTIATLGAGQHPITAVYGGDAVNSASTSFALPQSVNITPGVIAVAAGSVHSLALKSDGSVAAWGSNWSGQTTVPSAADSGVIAIAAGNAHSVALKSDGAVIAWGYNGYGQTTVPPTAGVIAIAAGGAHSVALKSDGSVIAWGYNGYGQTTVPVSASSGVVAIAAGMHHTVALKSDGSVVAWGYNSYSQTTIPASAASGVVAIAAGEYHTVALKSDGSVIAWGYNGYSQTAVPASAASGVVAIAAGGYHTVALKIDGAVIAWGYNGDGQNNVPPAAAFGVIAIVAGGDHTVALKSDGSVIAWGANWDGQSAPYSALSINPSGMVPAGQTVAITGNTGGTNCLWNGTVSTGTCTSASILKSTKIVLTASLPPNTIIDSWGVGCDASTATTCTINNLAANTTISPITAANAVIPGAPTAVNATAGILQAAVSFVPPVANGGSVIRSYTVTSSGGQSATGTSSPITVTGLGSMAYTFTVTATNGIGTGPASEPSESVTPAKMFTSIILSSSAAPSRSATMVTFSAIVTGSHPTGTVTFMDGAATLGTGILINGKAMFSTASLGIGMHDIVAVYDGDAANTASTSLVLTQPVQTPSGVIAVAAGWSHTLALKSDGSVAAWGDNSYGQTTVPAAIASGVMAIAAGWNHSVALKGDGSVVAWGKNDSGQATVPAAVSSGVVATSAGYAHTVVLKDDGAVLAWGSNYNDDWGEQSNQATVPPAAGSGVVAIAAGRYHTLALKADGSVIAWGDNIFGQATVPSDASSGVIAIAAGFYHSLALKSDGSVVAWGDDWGFYGLAAVPSFASTGITAISVGEAHSVALKSNGSVIAWGNNDYGQTTVPPAASSGVIAIAARGYRTVALKNDGSVIAWGDNGSGQNTVPYFTVTVALSGLVAPGQTITVSGDAGNISCVWDGTSASGICLSDNILATTHVVLTAVLPSNSIVTSWGIGCDSTTATTCTINSLAANATILPVFAIALPRLTVQMSGTGSGSVNSSPMSDIACIKGSTDGCSARFGAGDVTLTAVPDSTTSVFDGWTGACVTIQRDCVINMTSDATAVAAFALAPRSKLALGAITGYETVLLAYGDAVSTIFAVQGLFAGDWTLGKGTHVTLKGGYLADYGPTRTGHTTLKGRLNIKSGSLRVDGVKVHQ